MKKKLLISIVFSLCFSIHHSVYAQNIFSGEPVQVVGSFNGFTTTPYGTDYRTTSYRRITVTTGTPTDGRGQWKTTINVQASGGDVTPVNMPGGGGGGFLFISGPSGSRFQNKWNFNSVMQGQLNNTNNTVYQGADDMGLNMGSAGYYTFIFNDCGYTSTNSVFFVGVTTSAPVTVVRNSQVINNNGTSTIGITTSAAPSAQEKIFVRYTSGADFSGTGTSSLVQATGSGTSYTATIPTQTNGTPIRYFIFTSTQTLTQLNAATEINRSMAAINVDDNAGSNFLYTTVVPLRLVSFDGKTTLKANFLQWKTEEETNIDHFEIMRSADAQNFKTLGNVSSNNAANSNSYAWTDATALEKNNFYRLTIIDRDGKRSFSKTIKLSTNDDALAISVFPNPVVDRIKITLPVQTRGDYRVSVINLKGQVMFSSKSIYNPSNPTISIPLPANFSKGSYRLIISGNDKTYQGNFLVL